MKVYIHRQQLEQFIRQTQVSLDLFYAMHKEFGFEMKHVTCDGVPCKELGTDPRYGVFHATDEN